ncbi:major capsid protein [uncultured marine virus]|nr:major capsid protein [uncultured marine virus]
MTLDPSTAIAEPLYADLTNATGISINELRESIQIQRLYERDARGGTRYPELLKSHFGVSDPMMLVHQRPVFLGGGHTMINISPIAQTTQTSNDAAPNFENSPQGNLAGVGTITATGHGFTYSATEHGYITGVINVRADLTYQKGIERYWSRSTRFDYFYPALGHLGEMAVLNKELYQSDDPLIDSRLRLSGGMGRLSIYPVKNHRAYAFLRSSFSGRLASCSRLRITPRS